MHRIITAAIFFLTSFSCYSQEDLIPDFDEGVAYLKAGKQRKAAAVFSKVLETATEKKLKKLCHVYRGFAFRDLGQHGKALADLDQAVLIDPADPASYIDRGEIKIHLEDADGAKQDFLFVLTIDSTGKQGQAALYYLGKLTYQLNDFEESAGYYDKLIGLTPEDPELYFSRGAARGMLMKTEESITDYDKAILLRPGYKEAYANRGVAKINLLTRKGIIQPGKELTGDACTDLQKARQLGDNSVKDMIDVYCDVQ